MHSKCGKLPKSKEKKQRKRKGLKHSNKQINKPHEILFDVCIFNFFLHFIIVKNQLNFSMHKIN